MLVFVSGLQSHIIQVEIVNSVFVFRENIGSAVEYGRLNVRADVSHAVMKHRSELKSVCSEAAPLVLLSFTKDTYSLLPATASCVGKIKYDLGSKVLVEVCSTTRFKDFNKILKLLFGIFESTLK